MNARRTSSPWARARRTAAAAFAGALLLTGCEFSIYDMPLPGGADLGDEPYSVRVQFRDVLDLVPQSSVKVDDVTVGRVEEIRLDGYHAEVTLLVRGDVELPDDALASIRQTSLLGEKFVSLAAPEGSVAGPGNRLEEDDLIPLARTGRNPEVEEVLGAMSLLLNGGGVAQLRTIAVELSNALEGNEAEVRSVLRQLELFMSQLDDNRGAIVQAIEGLNELAISVKEQEESIELALDEMPAALASIDRQRDDLVRMLEALNELSEAGTQIIRASRASTVDALTSLDPVLTKLAEAGDAFPQSLQLMLTYPFVDDVVGRNPAQARDFHMGDYTNLWAQLRINAEHLEQMLGGDEGDGGEQPLDDLTSPLDDLTSPLDDLTSPVDHATSQLPLPGGGLGGSNSDGGGGGLLSSPTCGLLVNCRVAPSQVGPQDEVSLQMSRHGLDPVLAGLLLQGVVSQ